MFFQFLAQAKRLGPLEAPSDAFAPKTAESAAGALEDIISRGLGLVTVLAGLYFVMAFVVAAFNWLSAGGDTGKIKKARDTIINALIGLIIVVASFAVIGLIGSFVGLDILNPGAALLDLIPEN